MTFDFRTFFGDGMPTVRVIGVGNSFRGDDGVGLHVARRVKALVGARVEVLEAELWGIEVLDTWQGCHAVILVDAARSGAPPGTLHRWDASIHVPAQSPFLHSTHAINVLDALELARALGQLPPRVILYGVEVAHVARGMELSPPLLQAADSAARRIAREVEELVHA